MTTQEVEKIIRNLPEISFVEVKDTAGDGNHFHAVIVSETFSNLNRIKRHQLVFGALRQHIDSGELHAIELQTMTPKEHKEKTQ